jgi:hypothetical protein
MEKQKTQQRNRFWVEYNEDTTKSQGKKENDEVTNLKKCSLLDPLRVVHIPQAL